MFQIDEKIISDSRTLITVQGKKHQIDHLTKNGTLNYVMEGNNLWLTTPKVRKSYVRRNDATEVYDKVVLARDGIHIDGLYQFDDAIVFKDNVEIKKDLVVRGNFTVEGDTTIIDTPRLSVEDNIIELNRNEKGNGISLKRSGSAINRGSKPFARSIYDEDNKAFVFDTAAEMDLAVNANQWVAMGYAEKNGIYDPGEFRARLRLTAPHGKFTDSLSVTNQTTLNHLTVIGTTNLQGASTTADITINGKLLANNTSEFNGILTANKVSTFNDNVIMNKTLLVQEASTFNTLSTFNKGIRITNVGADITGSVDIKGTLNVTENATLKKDLAISANTITKTLEVQDKTKTNTLEVVSDAHIKRNTVIDGSLHVESNVVMNKMVTINHGPLTVNAETILNDNVNINNKNLIISSTADDNGKLEVGGHAHFKKTIDVDGNANFDGKVSIQGQLEMVGSDIIARNVTTKNDFKVESGDGKGLRFADSDNYKIYMSNSSNSSYGGRMDSSSDQNMYFKMSAGSNRGFAFKSNNDVVVQIEGSGQMRTKEKIIAHGYDVITRENEGHRSSSTLATGINADRLDGLHDFDFLRRNIDTDTNRNITFVSDSIGPMFSGGAGLFKTGALILRTDNAITNGVKVVTEDNTPLLTVKDHSVNGLLYKTHTVWHKGNQGHDSTLDSDTLDGRHASYFSPTTHLHDDRYIRNDEVNLKGKYKIEYNEDFDCLDFMYMGDTP